MARVEQPPAGRPRHRVAVTGASGFVGRRLVAALAEAGHEVLALDVTPPPDPFTGSVETRRLDILEGSLAVEFEGVDTVVHLAFQMDPIQDEARMRRVNIMGTRNVFECADEAGVGRVVYLSSAVAYGAHPDNDFPLTEQSALRANDDFNYAAMKGEVEAWLWPWAAEHPSLEVTTLRPAIILGPGVRNFITRQFEMPKLVSISGHRPPWQFVHVDDVVGAIQHVIEGNLSGAFNVAPEGWLSADEVEAILGRSTLAVPEELAFTVADQMWKAGVGDAPAGQVHYLMHPWVMSVDKLMDTGFRFQHSNRDTLGNFADEIRPYVTIGPFRAKRTTAAGVGLIGSALAAGLAVAGVRSVRSRRRRRAGRDDD